MRDRCPSLVLAVLAWVLALTANTCVSQRADAASCTARPTDGGAVLERGQAHEQDGVVAPSANAATASPRTVLAAAASATVSQAVGHADRSSFNALSSAQPRGPPAPLPVR